MLHGMMYGEMKLMNCRAILAVGICKAAHFMIRVLRRGGTAMPGTIAMKFYPDLAGVLAKGMEILVITGTNGKTTSARMVEEAMKDEGLDYIANRSGANLLSGITTELAMNATFTGRPKHHYAVI